MPIYEYVCNQCGERFEKLLLARDSAEGITCPYCGSKEAQKSVSAFASFGYCAPTPRGFR